MAIEFEFRHLQHHWEDALAQAKLGKEVILTEGGRPRARLVPISPPAKPRIAGLHPGAMEPAPDFDDPLPDEFWLGES